jgi:hypothetical protein
MRRTRRRRRRRRRMTKTRRRRRRRRRTKTRRIEVKNSHLGEPKLFLKYGYVFSRNQTKLMNPADKT